MGLKTSGTHMYQLIQQVRASFFGENYWFLADQKKKKLLVSSAMGVEMHVSE